MLRSTLIIPRAFFSDDMDLQEAEHLDKLYREGMFDEFNSMQVCLSEKRQETNDPDQ